MPESLDANTTIEKNKLAQGAWINLVHVQSPDATENYRVAQNNEDVSYGGNTYTKFNFGLSPETVGTDGAMPVRTLTVSNVSHYFDDEIYQRDGLDGWSVTVTPVNLNCITDDFSGLAREYEINGCEITEHAVTFALGGHALLRREFPLQLYMGSYCPFAAKWGRVENFGNCECGYGGESISNVVLSGTSPVQITATDHKLETGDVCRIEDVVGTTELNGNSYTVTRLDANNVTLDGTDSSDFSAYTSGGVISLDDCNGTLKVCRQLGNHVRWGGFMGLRDGAVRVV